MAEKLGVSRTTYVHWEDSSSGDDIKLKNVEKIVAITKCNQSWLLTGEGQMFNNNGNTNDCCAYDNIVTNVKNENYYGALVVKDIYKYVNNPSTICKDDMLFYVDRLVVQSTLSNNVKITDLVGYKVTDNLHSPIIVSGDVVIINFVDKDLLIEKTYLVKFQDRLILKKVIMDEEGIALIDTNPTAYKLRPEQVEVLGKVCYLIKMDM